MMLLGVGLLLAPAGTVAAVNVDPFAKVCDGKAGVKDSQVCDAKNDSIAPVITTVINVLLFAVGIISVIMIIIGGITYATSAGEAANVTRAKNTILYAIVGLVIAFLAYAIVNWVVLRFVNP